jgi:hypothetical protein
MTRVVAARARGLDIRDEKGEMNIGSILMLGISMVFLAVGFIMFPIATDATDSILAYVYTGNATITDASFTGLTAITGIVPLLILLGFISQAVIGGFLGIKIMKSGSGGKVNPGGLMLSGLSIVFIALGLIMFPVALDGIASVVHGGGDGISATYTGLSAILLVTPMLIEIAYVSAAVITGFFGLKSIGTGN